MSDDSVIQDSSSKKLVKFSSAALEQWTELINFWMCEEGVKQIIITCVQYTAGKDSDDGTREFCTPIVVNDYLKDTELEAYCETRTLDMDVETMDLALNRNILVVGYGAPPKLITLDIVDLKNDVTTAEIATLVNYTVLKTANSYHAYPKHAELTDSFAVKYKDPKWHMEYVRVTESERKGSIVKHE